MNDDTPLSSVPVPKVSVVDADSFSIGPLTASTFTPEVMEQIGRMATEVRDGVSVAVMEFGKTVSKQVQAIRAAGLIPPAEPHLDMSPRAVALRARQNRHTGPRGNHRQHRRR